MGGKVRTAICKLSRGNTAAASSAGEDSGGKRERVKLSERSDFQKNTYHVIPSCEMSVVGASVVTESSRSVVAAEFTGKGG